MNEVRLLVLGGEDGVAPLEDFMRTIFVLPLMASVAVLAGCGSEGSDQAGRSVPERDLTLVTQTALVEVASPMETEQPQRAARPARASRSTPLEPKAVLAAVAASAPVLADPEPEAESAGTAATPANDRELLPGKTVTLIPASSGPSTGPDEAEEFPPAEGRTVVARGGGTCRGRGRGPGIGIAAGPRPDFR